MNLRTLCRELGYPRAIALTYSFDPLFFERIILRDLWHGGTGDITIIGDKGELQEAINRCAGQFNFLGQKYLLSPANVHGAFHPKILLRVGHKGARLVVGTGNLTFGGWGGNKELSLNLELDADQPESAEIVNHVLDHIEPYLTADAARNAVARLRDFPWLINRDENVDHTVLITRPEEPLSTQLQQRWAGRRFDRMLVFTGSTDEKGAFIDWCHKRFGVQECTVAVSPENAAFIRKEIDKLAVNVDLAPFTGSQRLHAKFYWFDGPDGSAAIIGSANCSRAAWLMKASGGGNVEAIQVYDAPNVEEFQDVLGLFPEERVSVVREAEAKTEENEQDETSPYYLYALLLQQGLEFIEAKFNRALPPTAKVTLLGSEGIELSMSPRGDDTWWGAVSETDRWPGGPALALCRIEVDDEIYQTPLHWVDDLDAINNASHVRHIMPTFGGLTGSRTSSEYEKVVSDLALISSSLFSESAAYNDPQLRRQKQTSEDGNQSPAEPVTPEDLIKSLNDLEINELNQSTSLGPAMHLSFFGVLRALFEEAKAQSDDTEIDKEAQSGDNDSVNPDGDTSKESSKTSQTHREPPPDRYRQRLRGQLENFFAKFSSKEFAEECTATKMVQAAAYPLAVAMLGERGKWLRHEESRELVTQVVDVLLNRQRPGMKARGLLQEVGDRYQEKEQYDVFLQVVGDGTLWVALLATLAQVRWQENFERFERAINLYRVYSCEVLRSDTSVGKLGALVTRIQVEKAKTLITDEAPEIAEAIDAIESVLAANYEELIEKQKRVVHQEGDLIWNQNVGWGVVKIPGSGTSMEVYLHLRASQVTVLTKGFYVNLRAAAEDYPIINESMNFIFGECY